MSAPDITLLFLAARSGVEKAMQEMLASEVTRCKTLGDACGFVRIAEDPFRDFVPGARGFEATLELRLDPAARPEALAGLGERIDGLVQRDLSAVVVGHDHEFVAGGPGPIRYQYLMRRRHDFDPARYLAHYGTVHADIGVRTPGKLGYSQVHAALDDSRRAAEVLGFGAWQIDSVSRLWIESPEAFLAAAGSVGQEALADERGFVDGANSVMFASRPLP